MYHRWLLSELAKAHVGTLYGDVSPGAQQPDSVASPTANPDTREAVREAMATQLEQCAELAEAMEQDGESSKCESTDTTALLLRRATHC